MTFHIFFVNIIYELFDELIAIRGVGGGIGEAEGAAAVAGAAI
jgi:hypothetical protein